MIITITLHFFLRKGQVLAFCSINLKMYTHNDNLFCWFVGFVMISVAFTSLLLLKCSAIKAVFLFSSLEKPKSYWNRMYKNNKIRTWFDLEYKGVNLEMNLEIKILRNIDRNLAEYVVLLLISFFCQSCHLP